MFLNTEKHKEIIIRTVLFVLNIAVAVAIFVFSSQPAELSDSVSGGLVYKVLDIFTSLPADKLAVAVESFNGIARKLAHFSIYAVFAVCSSALLSRYNIKRKTKVLSAFTICFLYAVSDEIHQYFVPGRSCELRDVLIDTSGVIAGIVIYHFIKYIISKFIKNKGSVAK